jgi:glycosyltransferase involved in cell wall biosynthesis
MTNKNILMSVITPVLNSGKYIVNCIESVKKQENNVEHIIIDGGSIDDTLEIVKSYPDIQVISEPDKGMYDAINKGLELAKGDIVGYLNADDRYLKDTVSKVIYVFENKPEVDFVYGACTYINDNEEELYTYKSLPYSNKLFRNMKRICWAQSSCFWRKSLHDKIGGFDPSLKYCGDYSFFLSFILNKFRGHKIDDTLSLFMIHDDCLSVKSKEEMFREYKEIELKNNLKRNAILGFIGEIYFKLINITVYPKMFTNRQQIVPRWI